jgi:hypothetical protein
MIINKTGGTAEKAARYLLEGRLTVVSVFATEWDKAHIEARCKGSGEIYRLGRELNAADFTDAPVNDPDLAGPRLQRRLITAPEGKRP